MGSLPLMLRWSRRDLRANWLRVAAIALMIAIGTGAYAGLSSSTTWRSLSNDASFGALGMHDLEVELPAGGLAPQGTLAAVAANVDHAEWIEAAEERLIVATQVDASTPDETVLVPGSIVGVDLAVGPAVDGFHIETGRGLLPDDSDTDNVLLEHNFARFYDLAATGTIAVSGGRGLTYVGQALTPEYFIVAPEGELFFSEANFAGVFTSIETAQRVAGLPGRVNDLVVAFVPEADRELLAEELDAAFATAGIGVEIGTRDDDTAFRLLTRDADNDQRFFNVFAFLIFAGAAGAAFTLINRLVEQQRREMGIGMSLGVPPRRIAIRPLLVAAQIALLGVILGVGMGMLVGSLMRTVLVDLLPMPSWRTPFQFGIFARAAIAGFVVPFVAAAIPVRRAVRLTPVQALRPAHLTVRSGWLSRVTRNAPIPGDSFTQMPVRNLTRFPRRTLLTVLAIAASITVLVALLGIVDSFLETVNIAEEEALGATPDRVLVDLDGLTPAGSPDVAAIRDASTVETADPVLRVAATVRSDEAELDVLVDLVDLDEGFWRPTLTAGSVDEEPGIVLTEAAADDLGVAVGDTVVLRHPLATGPASLTLAETEVAVAATHPYPMRPVAYMDIDHAGIMNLAGFVNGLSIDPAPGVTEGQVSRELFGLDSVAAVRPAGQATQQVRDALDQMMRILQVISFFALLLALLIAVNSAGISLDARKREHASMFAFGVPVRTALRMSMTESLIVGVLATLLGIAGGLGVIWWMLTSLLGDTMPDFAAVLSLKPSTITLAALLGVVTVAFAPIFTVRRMRRMDVPGTLRLVE